MGIPCLYVEAYNPWGQRTPDPVADDANIDGPSGYVKGRLPTPVM